MPDPFFRRFTLGFGSVFLSSLRKSLLLERHRLTTIRLVMKSFFLLGLCRPPCSMILPYRTTSAMEPLDPSAVMSYLTVYAPITCEHNVHQLTFRELSTQLGAITIRQETSQNGGTIRPSKPSLPKSNAS